MVDGAVCGPGVVSGAPKVAIAVDQGFSARYLLRTDILPTLRENGVSVVVFAPNAHEAYLRDELAAQGVALQPLTVVEYDHLRARPLQSFLRALRFYVMGDGGDLTTVDVRYRIYRSERRGDGLRRRLVHKIFDGLVWALRRSRTLRRVLVLIESRMFVPRVHRDALAREAPDLAVVASLGNLGHDDYFMREARAVGARVASVIQSWDNTSTKGLPGATADDVVAWTDTMRQELWDYTDVPPERVFVGGVAHFDTHLRSERQLARADLCARLGLDPGRPVLLLALRSPNKYPWNPAIVEALGAALVAGRFARPCQIVVRLHPLNFAAKGGRYRWEPDTLAHMALRGRFPGLVYDVPQTLSRALPMDMPPEEMGKLSSLLAHADVLMSFFSTMMLEAALFDLPMVNVCLYTHNQKLDPRDLVAARFPHIRRVEETGGFRSAYDMEQLIAMVNDYLLDRSRDSEGRRRIRENECGPFPGQAGRRIGAHLAQLAHAARAARERAA